MGALGGKIAKLAIVGNKKWHDWLVGLSDRFIYIRRLNSSLSSSAQLPGNGCRFNAFFGW